MHDEHAHMLAQINPSDPTLTFTHNKPSLFTHKRTDETIANNKVHPVQSTTTTHLADLNLNQHHSHYHHKSTLISD